MRGFGDEFRENQRVCTLEDLTLIKEVRTNCSISLVNLPEIGTS